MKRKDLLLTGILLLLIGVTIGTLIALYTINEELAPLAEVRMTEINKSSKPFISDDELAKSDARFLFRKVASTVTPTVVYIETIIPAEEAFSDGNPESDDKSIWERLMPQRIRTVGSGVLITADGYILTNYHVIEGAVKRGLKVVLSDKREYDAKIVGVDTSTDLAVIKINASDLPAITVGNSDEVEVGEWVLAVGNPFRLQSTVTAGIVSALSRDVQIIDDRMRIESFIQTDAAINKGNSGGALVNTSGQLVGINTAIASQSGAYQGYGFAVPSNLAIKIAADIIEYGEVRRALLGISIASVDYNRAMEKGMNTVRGVEVLSVAENGAALESGIKPGDVVLVVNGVQVNESNQLQQQIAIMKPGESAELVIWRDGNEFTKKVETKALEPQSIPQLASESNEEEEHTFDGKDLGVIFQDFDIGFRIMAIEKDGRESDLMVAEVVKSSEAWNRGLREHHQILSIDKEKVENLSIFEELLEKKLEENGAVILEVIDKNNVRGFIELKQYN